MQTETFEGPTGQTTFNHSGDGHGFVVIRTADGVLSVPFEHVFSFVAAYIKQRKIDNLESASAERMLMEMWLA